MTTNNDTLTTMIEQTLTAYQEYEARKEREAKEKQEQKERETKEALRHLIEEFLTEEFRASVEFTYKHKYEYGKILVEARFSYLQVEWVLDVDQHGWHIAVIENVGYYARTKVQHIQNQHLQARLLIEMGKYRQEWKLRDEQEQYRKAQQKRDEQRKQEAIAKAEHEQKKRADQAASTHNVLLGRFSEEKARVERDRWRWPEGTTIEIYRVRWQTGSHRERDEYNEEQGASFDYESGWTATSHLDHQGRIKIESVRSPYANRAKEGRTIQLSLNVHRPVWEVYTIASTEDLPESLTLDVVVSLPHVVERTNRDLGRPCLMEIKEDELDYEESWYAKTIGRAPLPWIQKLANDIADGN